MDPDTKNPAVIMATLIEQLSVRLVAVEGLVNALVRRVAAIEGNAEGPDVSRPRDRHAERGADTVASASRPKEAEK